MRTNGILRVVTRFLIPLILLFGLYVQFHGEYSPGGGFQAGLVFASAWILFALIYGLDDALSIIPERAQYIGACIGVLLYASVGLLGVALGGRYLDFAPLASSPQTAQQIGILLVEFGVGVTVSTVSMLFFTYFARRKQLLDDMVEED